MQAHDLRGKVALVTGGAQRVGKVIALALADEGVDVMVHYHRANPEAVEGTLEALLSRGVRAFAVQADISQAAGVERIMDAFDGHYGRLDFLVNSASAFPAAPLMDVSLESWDLTMNVNVRAPFLLTQACAGRMKGHDGGAIVNIVDQGAYAPWPKRPHHGISKSALWMLTQVSAVSLAPDVRVNAIAPGPIMKPDGMDEATWQRLGRNLPLQRVGDAEDVGRAVIFLLGQPFITGTLLHVNGGEHLTYPIHDYDED